jgi:hypothetical protein
MLISHFYIGIVKQIMHFASMEIFQFFKTFSSCNVVEMDNMDIPFIAVLII